LKKIKYIKSKIIKRIRRLSLNNKQFKELSCILSKLKHKLVADSGVGGAGNSKESYVEVCSKSFLVSDGNETSLA
jgi:hypothetical protein